MSAVSLLICLNVSEVWGGRCSKVYELRVSALSSALPLAPCDCKPHPQRGTLRNCQFTILSWWNMKWSAPLKLLLSRQRTHLVGQVAVSKPRPHDFGKNMKGYCLLDLVLLPMLLLLSRAFLWLAFQLTLLGGRRKPWASCSGRLD